MTRPGPSDSPANPVPIEPDEHDVVRQRAAREPRTGAARKDWKLILSGVLNASHDISRGAGRDDP